jgi:hypothetical protein
MIGARAYHGAYTHMTAPVNTTIVTHTHVRERTSRQPSWRSWSTDGDSAATPGPAATTGRAATGRGWTRIVSSALTTNVAASSANASPAPTPSTSTVAMAGPMRNARFAIVSVIAFASWSSVAGTVWGMRPVYAGWKNACAPPNRTSITTSSQIDSAPAKISAASSACSPARVRSVAMMIRCLGSRSAHTPPNSSRATSESVCAPSTSPRSVGEPVRCVMYRASATSTTRSPMTLAA